MQLHKDKIIILGFPSDDFGGQEPGSDDEIAEFCKINFGVTFQLFHKDHVKGFEKQPVYQWLCNAAKNGWNNDEPTWNFCKYLVDEQGELTHFFSSSVSPLSEEILKAMRRRYMRSLYTERIALINALIPNASIGADVIVGFPGETEEHFMETFNYLHQLNITYLHVFTYSERVNTLAVTMDDTIPMNVRKNRNRMLRNLSLKKQHAFYQSQLGKKLPVLFEVERSGELMYGYSSNYIRVAHPYNESLVNKIIICQINTINPEGFAEVILLGETVTV